MADNEHPSPARQPDVAGAEPAVAPRPEPAAEPATRPPARPPAAPPGQPPAVVSPTGVNSAPPPALRQPTEPVPIDAEQVRQFQQFQQFQQLMRQQQEPGTPPPPGQLVPWAPQPQRGPARRFLRALAGKLATAVLTILLLIGAGYFAIDYFFGDNREQLPASQVGGGKAKTNLLYAKSPRGAVQKVYDDISQDDAVSACGRFTDEARAQFVDNFSEYGSTCDEIVHGINEKVVRGMKSDYANPSELTSIGQPTSDTMVVSSCTLGVRGGPPLGELTVSKMKDSVEGQWIVTEHLVEPQCASVSGSVPPPTS